MVELLALAREDEISLFPLVFEAWTYGYHPVSDNVGGQSLYG